MRLRKRIENDQVEVSGAAAGSFREILRTCQLDEDSKYCNKEKMQIITRKTIQVIMKKLDTV